jgi:CPA2 family monovalent cation:H+ antiporter-2
MPHETALIAALSIGLSAAFVGGLLATRVKLPPLVGYILAGVAIGPFTPGFVADAGIAAQLAEIGVILLMFGVGLHFSIDDLLAVRRIAVPGAVVQISLATLLGMAVARFWGWPWGQGLVFGLCLSVASTVVLLRALEERNAVDSPNGRIAVGWLIVEDLFTVLALVMLPALAGALGGTPQSDSNANVLVTLAWTLGKVALFVALMLIGGARVIPWLMERVARLQSRELFTLCVLAISLGVAFGAAELFHVSFALGAFFAGMVVGGSRLSKEAAENSLPFQDAFAVLFFVSVGMMFDYRVLFQRPIDVLVTLAIIVLGKSLGAFAIVKLLRYPTATALSVSAALAQIGEFSFILAGLAVSLGLLSELGQSLILAGAILSIVINPFLFRAAAR